MLRSSTSWVSTSHTSTEARGIEQENAGSDGAVTVVVEGVDEEEAAEDEEDTGAELEKREEVVVEMEREGVRREADVPDVVLAEREEEEEDGISGCIASRYVTRVIASCGWSACAPGSVLNARSHRNRANSCASVDSTRRSTSSSEHVMWMNDKRQ